LFGRNIGFFFFRGFNIKTKKKLKKLTPGLFLTLREKIFFSRFSDYLFKEKEKRM